MDNRPNIFDYATKELSQDAVVCWILKCCHSDNDTYKSIGLDFIKFILDDESITANDIELEKNSPHAQYYRMDVYANVRIGERNIPIIFEDKTDTFLHGDQEKRYVERVNWWKNDKKWEKWRSEMFTKPIKGWGDIRFVFFKSGFVFDWQKVEIENLKLNTAAKVKTIYIDNMLEFIEKHKDKDLLLADYYQYLSARKENLEKSVEAKNNEYFNKIFGDAGWFQYNYQEWASRDFGYMEDESKKEENRIWYTVKTGWRKNKDKNEYEYSIGIQQYRNEKLLYGSDEKKKLLTEQRYILTDEAREICKVVADGLNAEINLENNDKNRMPNENHLFKLFIDEKNEDDVCAFFRKFIKEFNSLAKDKYKDKYIIY